MNFTNLLLILGLMGAACRCPDNCRLASECLWPSVKHVSELQNSSVAPWILKAESVEGREPQFLQNAVCMGCTVEDMVAKAIKVKIQVYQRVQHNSTHSEWCRCPYELAVGCTCVREQAM